MFFDRLVRIVLPRQDFFFTLLEEIAGRITASADVFAELADAKSHEQFEDIADRHEADRDRGGQALPSRL